MRLLLIAVLMITAYFNTFSQDVVSKSKEALSSIEEWLQVVDEGNYDSSWVLTSDLFKNALSKEDWNKTLLAVRKPLGKVLSRELISKSYHTELPGAPDGEYYVVQYKTSFENKKNSVETITPKLVTNGKWKVSGYFIK